MAETEGASKVSAPPRPSIFLPPHSSFETLFTGGPGLSPGPMTLVSNFFSDQYPDSDCRSFSQLLAGAMASPVAAIAAAKPNFVANNSADSSSKETISEDKSEKNLGYKQNRPMNLVVAHSPMFLLPPGLSPPGLLNSPGFFSPGQSPFGMSHQEALAHVTAQAALSQSYLQIQAEHHPSSLAASAESLKQQSSFAPNPAVQQQMHAALPDPESSKMESSEVSHSDKKSRPTSLAIGKPANDGYNWRKYGQKQVKASEYPRSYYKCTYHNCPVKKKVESSLDGQITEITYKGQHNHELPQPSRRTKDAGNLRGSLNSQVKPELGMQVQADMIRSDEKAPSHSLAGNDQVSIHLNGSVDCEDAELRVDEENDDEPNPKRRSTEVGSSELASSQKAVTEPRIVVQTRSEVDLLDDGFKWRKYGQKVVKGNPHPRSYYKCTHAGCNVRKHVERASTDPKAVITSYEGKHNHDIPATRNRSHNTANINPLPSKPQTVVAGNPLHKEMDFGKDQRQVLLQLKGGQITA